MKNKASNELYIYRRKKWREKKKGNKSRKQQTPPNISDCSIFWYMNIDGRNNSIAYESCPEDQWYDNCVFVFVSVQMYTRIHR